ncbi:MAG: hypothetical protein LBR93_11670 [Treponema sp.]|jgi:hypothetical protein|nr:hypothetical protein [Treponema sp.]
MKISTKHVLDFKDYLLPLSYLEKAFRAAGVDVEFRAQILGETQKWVDVDYGNRAGSICIEGDNPAAVVKDVAAAVTL